MRHPTPPPKSGGQSQASAISAAEAYGYFMKPNLNIKLGPGKPRRNAKDTITVDSASGEEDEPPKKRVPKKKKAATDADMPGPAKTRIPKKKSKFTSVRLLHNTLQIIILSLCSISKLYM